MEKLPVAQVMGSPLIVSLLADVPGSVLTGSSEQILRTCWAMPSARRVGVSPVMNARTRVSAAFLLLTIGFWTGSAALGQAGGGGSEVDFLPPEAYTDPTGGARAKITAFISANLARVLDKEVAAQVKGRKSLMYAPTMGTENGKLAEPPFLLEYARQMDQAVSATLKGNVPARAKINVAIVVARVAEKTQSAALAGCVTMLIKDNSQAVTLWGLKAAQPIMPGVGALKVAGGLHPLIAAIRPAVAKYPSGIVYDEAYTALGAVPDKGTCDEIKALWAERIKQYQATIPQDPAAECKPILALTKAEVWQKVYNKPAEQAQIMGMLHEQLTWAAKRGDLVGGDPSQRDQHDQFVRLVQMCASGALVVADRQGLNNLGTAAAPLDKLNPTTFPASAKLEPLVKPLVEQLAAAFPGAVKKP